MGTKLAYYARCMMLYGTPQEKRDILTIAMLGYTVIAFPPQAELNERKARGENVMETVFQLLVARAEVLFFRGLIDGNIPAGVYKEIGYAQDMGLPVLELPSRLGRRGLSVEETREVLAEVGQR